MSIKNKHAKELGDLVTIEDDAIPELDDPEEQARLKARLRREKEAREDAEDDKTQIIDLAELRRKYEKLP